MIWLTWRQYRIEILVLGIFLLLVAAILLITGWNIASVAQHAGNTTCLAQHCINAQQAIFDEIYKAFGTATSYNLFQYTLLALPPIMGMFVGTHTLARELEQGTYRLVWTQSISWSRWLFLKICFITCFALGVTALLYGLLAWWKIPMSSISISNDFSLWGSTNYDVWGIVAIAYTLFTLALGICAGTILRKTVPAMAVTLVIFVAVRILIVIFWRPYFLPPAVLMLPFNGPQNLPQQSLLIGASTTVDRQGNPVDPYNGVCKLPSASLENHTSSATLQLNMALPLMNITRPVRLTHTLSGGPTSPRELAQEKAYEQCTVRHDFQDKYLYQPADRFWLFQGIECGIYVLISAILLALTFWWTKYRIIGRLR